MSSVGQHVFEGTASTLAPVVRRGEVSQSAVVSAILDRYDTSLKFSSLFMPTFKPEEIATALGGAQTPADKAKTLPGGGAKAGAAPKGALAGVPVVVAPAFDMKDVPATAGTATMEASKPTADAPVIAALKNAGAFVLGQAVTSELNASVVGTNAPYGTPKNPFSLIGLAGGSASGPAAAVSARLAPVAIALDTVGDVRVPASLCGCVGFRPTHGRYVREGALSLSSTLDSVGILARSVRDVQLVDAVLCSAQKMEEKLASAEAEKAEKEAARALALAQGLPDPTEADAAKDGAVTAIQAGIRGFLARKRVEKIKEAEAPPAEEAAAEGGEGEAKPKAKAAPEPSYQELAQAKAEAAAKIQALARGKKDRAYVARVKTQQAGAETRLDALVAADEAAAAVDQSDSKAIEAAEGKTLDTSKAKAAPVAVGPGDDAILGGGEAGAEAQSGRAAFVRDLKGVRIGVPKGKYYAALDVQTAALVDTTLSKLRKAGAVLVEVDFAAEGHPMDLAEDVAGPISAYEAPRELSSYLFTHVGAPVPPPKVKGEGEEEEEPPAEEEEDEETKKAKAEAAKPKPLDTVVSVTGVLTAFQGAAADRHVLLAQLDRATAVTAETYRSALVHRRPALKRAFTTYLKSNKLAALVYPTTPVPALQLKGPENAQVELPSAPGALVDAAALYSRNTKAASAAGLPALSVPIGLTKATPGAPARSPGSERLPVGLELVAAPGDDERLLALGRALQKLVPSIPDPVTMARWNEGVTHY